MRIFATSPSSPTNSATVEIHSRLPTHNEYGEAERRRIRRSICNAFDEIFGEPASIRFEDECPECGMVGQHAPECVHCVPKEG